jgi:hypothetical protein
VGRTAGGCGRRVGDTTRKYRGHSEECIGDSLGVTLEVARNFCIMLQRQGLAELDVGERWTLTDAGRRARRRRLLPDGSALAP